MNKKIINKVIYFLKAKYIKYAKYLPDNLYDEIISEIIYKYDKDMGVSPELYLLIETETRILKTLCLLAYEGNIDIEIDLMNQYYNKLNLILNKMNLNFSEKEKEDILISSIESYKGEKLFSLHMVKVVKTKIKNTLLNQDIAEINLETSKTYIVKSFEERIANLLSNKELVENVTYIEEIFSRFNLLELIDANDEKFYTFVYLKYGYYNNIYFSINDIAIILNMKVSDAKKYYIKSLNLLKQVINKKVDEIFKFKEKEKYLKK